MAPRADDREACRQWRRSGARSRITRRRCLAAWAGRPSPHRQRALIDRIADWRPALDAAPQTLVHNDFNPRNICSEGRANGGWRLCAYDWELAAIGTPMRDLAELLCFVAPAAASAVDRSAHRSPRRALRRDRRPGESPRARATFAAALAEVLIDRLSVYAMVHRVRPQRFLPRVVRTWSPLHSLFPAHGLAG